MTYVWGLSGVMVVIGAIVVFSDNLLKVHQSRRVKYF